MSLLRQIQCCNPVAIPGTGQWTSVSTIEMHTGGEPLRVVLSGVPALPDGNVLENRRYLRDQHDHLRTALMFEPRGHADMYGCVLVEPNDADADIGVVFMHNEGYSTMCGHAIIALTRLVFQMGWKPVQPGSNPLVIDAPCGRIFSRALVEDGRIADIRFQCVPSFAVGLDRHVRVPGLGTVQYDLAYGGAFYAYVDLRKNDFDFRLTSSDVQTLIQAGRDIKQAVTEFDQEIVHPFEPDLGFLYGTVFIDEPSSTTDREGDPLHSRNVCVFADGEVDRCPTGSGVSGRMAIHYRRGEVAVGQEIKIESIAGSVFSGSVVRQVRFGPHTAVIPEVAGMAHITGYSTFLIDPDDPLGSGFLLR